MVKNFKKKIESFENLFRKMKEVHIEIYNFIFTFHWPKKFISWTTRKTQMTVFSAGTKRSGDTHRGTSTISNISSQSRYTWFHLKNLFSIS